MRERKLIEKDPKATDLLMQEILLDIREVLMKANKPIIKKRGRPKKTKKGVCEK